MASYKAFVGPQSAGVAVATCPGRSKVVAGGFASPGFSAAAAPRVITMTSKRVGPDQWRVEGFNLGNDNGNNTSDPHPGTLIAYAYCLDDAPRIIVRHKRVSAGVRGAVKSFKVRCPRRTRALSGRVRRQHLPLGQRDGCGRDHFQARRPRARLAVRGAEHLGALGQVHRLRLLRSPAAALSCGVRRLTDPAPFRRTLKASPRPLAAMSVLRERRPGESLPAGSETRGAGMTLRDGSWQGGPGAARIRRSADRPGLPRPGADGAGAATKWLCRPGTGRQPVCAQPEDDRDLAHREIEGIKNVKPAKHPKIDCFYVYPTVSDQTRPQRDPQHRSRGALDRPLPGRPLLAGLPGLRPDVPAGDHPGAARRRRIHPGDAADRLLRRARGLADLPEASTTTAAGWC